MEDLSFDVNGATFYFQERFLDSVSRRFAQKTEARDTPLGMTRVKIAPLRSLPVI
jgi:hypothetical protein